MSEQDARTTGSSDVPEDAAEDTTDYGGLGAHLDQLDLEHADEIGADPPGPSGLDLGGSGTMGQDIASGAQDDPAA